MTTQGLRIPLPSHLQPTAKTASTAKSSHLSATANSTPTSSRASSHSRLAKPRQSPRNQDYASEKATVALIRRVLCSSPNYSDQKSLQRPIEELLPPLTSSNDVDLQLYAIIAIIIKDFVNSWYSKITADHVFVEEVVQVIAHCTRALEQRLRRIDLQELILDEIPALCASHIQAYKNAHEECQSSAYSLDPRSVYHAFNPHPALTPTPVSSNERSIQEQSQNESVYRHLLVQGVLAVLLPTEDLENPALRTLVGDVVAELILGQVVSGKVCEGWFIWQTISKVAEVVKARIEPKADGEEIESATRSRLEKFGLLSAADGKNNTHLPPVHQSRLSALFWRILQYGYLAFVFVRFVIVGLLQARTALPRPYPTKVRSTPSSPSSAQAIEAGLPKRSWSPAPPALRRPVLEYRSFTFLATTLDLSTHMPWLEGFLSLLKHFLIDGPGRIAEANGLLDRKWVAWILIKAICAAFRSKTWDTGDQARTAEERRLDPPYAPYYRSKPSSVLDVNDARLSSKDSNVALLGDYHGFFSQTVQTQIFPPSLLPQLLLALRTNLFPHNTLGPPGPPPPSAAEAVLAIRREAAVKLLALLPEAVVRVYFSTEGKEEAVGQVEELLEVFGDAYCNKHLVFGVLDWVVVRLCPEMGMGDGRGVKELLEERIGGW